jgi:hypothetical protein
VLYNVLMINCNSSTLCSQCFGEKPVVAITEVVITQNAVNVQLRLCDGCLATAKQSARRSNGNIVVRELTYVR